MWYADQDKRPMNLAIFGTIIGLAILSLLWWFWHLPTEKQQVNSHFTTGAPAQRHDAAVGDGQPERPAPDNPQSIAP